MKGHVIFVLTANATEAPHKLTSLLRLVRDDFQCGAKALVVVRKPLEQLLGLDQFHLDAALRKKDIFLFVQEQQKQQPKFFYLLVREVALVLFLFGRQMQHRRGVCCRIFEHIPLNV